ncbi:MAG: polyprenyl synthetase family protein [Planctomycetes bacterium]|nr:polyprenyl synthetase family protein [Planctomycetota bacterium]
MVEPSQESFSAYTEGLRKHVETALDGYTHFSTDCPERLAEAIRYSLLAPAKRLRPLLVLLAAEACGGSQESAMPAACAVEMIHTYSLIHDDLPAMDDDDLRRGRPTCHKVYGESAAILAGDALQALAFEVLARGIRPAAAAAECCAALAVASGPTALVGGQAADLAAEFHSEGIEFLEAIHRRKTGALFLVSLELGAIAAGGTPQQRAALTVYGERLGLAFQITDDLLDVRGDQVAVGKRVGKDTDRGKLTFPSLLGIDESSRRAGALVAEACAAIAPLAPAAHGLELLARYVIERDR